MCSKYIVRSEMDIRRQSRTHPDFLELLNFVRHYIDSKSYIKGEIEFDEQTGKLNIRIEHEQAHIRTVQRLDKHLRAFDPYLMSFARIFWQWNIWDGVVYIGRDAERIRREDKFNPVKLGLLRAGFSRDQVKAMMEAADITEHKPYHAPQSFCNELSSIAFH